MVNINFPDFSGSLNPAEEEMLQSLLAKADQPQNAWAKQLRRESSGKIMDWANNYVLFLENHPCCKGMIKLNDFTGIAEFNGKMLDDKQVNILMSEAQNAFDIKVQKVQFSMALDVYTNMHKYNPVEDYLKSLSWDGKKRAEKLFIDWLGAQDTQLTRTMTIKWLLAAVKRSIHPGTKFDNMIILQCSEGGGGKTTLCQRLGLEFGNETMHLYNELTGNDLDDDKKSTEKTDFGWIITFDELQGMNKKEIEKVKTFMSQTVTYPRMSYDKRNSEHRRHCVFIGSTNETNFLRDYTGSVERRFWVIPTTTTMQTNRVWYEFTREVVDQIWAEVYWMYMMNPDVQLDLPMNMYEELRKIQYGFKSFNGDPDMDWYRDVLLNTEYEVDLHDQPLSVESFKNNIKGIYVEGRTVKKIKKIPVIWVKQAAQEFKVSFSGSKYIAAGVGCEYKQAKFQGKNWKCFCLENAVTADDYVKDTDRPSNAITCGESIKLI